MAFPFPGYPSAPQTPQHFPIPESPSMPRKSNPNAAYKRTALAVAIAFTILLWMMGPWFASPNRLDNVPFSLNTVEDYFAHFEGHQDCGIMSSDLYTPPIRSEDNGPVHKLYCSNRATLLEAMGGGGRHGFERPYFPAGCHYRWYSTAEICMILERFDAIIFIGDDTLKHIYAAFNILLRENLAIGGLKQWEMTETDRVLCRCENQFTRAECSAHILMDSQVVADNDPSSGHRSPYYCNRTPHMFFPIKDSPAPEDLRNRFTSILGQDPDAYKPIPVIHALSLSTSLSWATATSSMDEWVSLADASGRNVPFLWVGPTAAGHLKPAGQILSQGNNALWHYTIETEKEAKSRELDALGMYNLTLQANSWDGSSYGQRVGLVQAMMVINWLSRVAST
ncbi:hypothetical protein JMJ35_003877 [Cladonia borealis]|uniref:Uncharacterized protein n=1 Tax=Cladonia borealis TaxID=184061 RepID=A0AA39V915_9LECA|nr:hypothetical protein JMJ35_003877 [Cladonia borealis]